VQIVRSAIVVLLVAPMLVLCSTQAMAFTGSLCSADGGLLGTGIWVDPGNPTVLSWTVTQNPDNTWHYMYQLSVFRGAPSHMIVEVSPAFTKADVLSPSVPMEMIHVAEFGPGPSNPGIPGSFKGAKFEGFPEQTSVVIYFDSPRQPVWGDFYSKDGKAGGDWNAVWNAGFLADDPSAPPSDGSLNYHVLVPDTVVPEPGAFASVALGGLGLGFRLRRRN